MREVCFVALITMLTCGSVFAQPATGQSTTGRTWHAPGKPIDNGPFTPEANRAYQGGGVILQGPPGAPPPRPQPLPPEQPPRNTVPPG
ncbi:MAG TPA: hypothetical protein VIZ17_06005 [Acetobacteraceae bacterium]